MKICKKCQTEKPLTAFHKYSKAPDGYRAACKDCLRGWFADYYQRNKERISDRVKAYRRLPEVKKKASERMTRIYYLNRNNPEYKEKVRIRQRKSLAKSPRYTLARSLKHGLNRRHSDNPITVDQLMDLFRAQNGKCAVTSITMTWFQGKTMPTSISLDRIDCDLGYELGNIRLVCHAVNCFRGRMSDDEMFNMAMAIVANMKKPKLRIVA